MVLFGRAVGEAQLGKPVGMQSPRPLAGNYKRNAFQLCNLLIQNGKNTLTLSTDVL